MDHISKYNCLICDTVISHGKLNKPRKFSTSSMMNHLRTKHRKEYDELQKHLEESKATAVIPAPPSTSAAPSSKTFKQPLLVDTLERAKVWDTNNPSAVRIHRAVVTMLVTDIEPWRNVTTSHRESILLNGWFHRYMMKFVLGLLDPEMNWSISFTTDTWTAENTVQSFMG